MKMDYLGAPKEIQEAISTLGLKTTNGSDYINNRFGGLEKVTAKKIIHLWTVDRLLAGGQTIYDLQRSSIEGTCPNCHGAGSIVKFTFAVAFTECLHCKGTGKTPEVICRFCNAGKTKAGVKCTHCKGTGLYQSDCSCVVRERKSNRVILQGREQKIITGIKGIETCYACKGTGGKIKTIAFEESSISELLQMI